MEWKGVLANYIWDMWLIARTYKKKKLQKKIQSIGKQMNWPVLQRRNTSHDAQWRLLANRETHIKTSLTFYLIQIRMSVIKKAYYNNLWWLYGGRKVFVHSCLGGCRQVQPMRKSAWRLLKAKNRTAIYPSYSGSVPKGLNIIPERELYACVYCCGCSW